MQFRILWIDDEPVRYRVLINNWDKEEELPEVVFAHGADQIEHALQHMQKFDLILLDHDMPLLSGPEVVKQYLVELSTPVIIVSMNRDGAAAMKAELQEAMTPVQYCSITNGKRLVAIIKEYMNKRS